MLMVTLSSASRPGNYSSGFKMSESSRPRFLGRAFRLPIRPTKNVSCGPAVDACTLEKAARDKRSPGVYSPLPLFLLVYLSLLRRSQCGARSVPHLPHDPSSVPEEILRWESLPPPRRSSFGGLLFAPLCPRGRRRLGETRPRCRPASTAPASWLRGRWLHRVMLPMEKSLNHPAVDTSGSLARRASYNLAMARTRLLVWERSACFSPLRS